MYVSAPHGCRSCRVQSEHWIPRNWSYRWLCMTRWMLEATPRSSQSYNSRAIALAPSYFLMTTYKKVVFPCSSIPKHLEVMKKIKPWSCLCLEAQMTQGVELYLRERVYVRMNHSTMRCLCKSPGAYERPGVTVLPWPSNLYIRFRLHCMWKRPAMEPKNSTLLLQVQRKIFN